MKRIYLIAISLLVCISCNSTKTTVTENNENRAEGAVAQSSENPVPKPKTMLLGKEDRSALKVAPFDAWYNRSYASYTVKEDQKEDITKGLKGVTITTFMGTWCGDSKRETPRMFKILDQTGFDEQDLELITVDRSKRNPKEYTEGKDIRRVPTFIFKKDGEEIGRIVERPVESLEEDMVKILNGEPYKHAYEH